MAAAAPGSTVARARPLLAVRAWPLVEAACSAVWLVAVVLALASQQHGEVNDGLVGPALIILTAASTVAAVTTARGPGLEPRARSAWRWTAVAFAMLTLSNLLFASDQSFPSPGDVARLAACGPLLVGLLRLPQTLRTRVEQARLALDIGVVVAGGFMALWYWSLGPVVVAGQGGHRPWLVVVTTAAYALADLVLLFGATTALLRGVAEAVRVPLVLTVLGLALVSIADLVRGSLGSRAGGGTSPLLEWLALLTGFWLLALAATEQRRRGSQGPVRLRETHGRAPVTLLPYAAVVAGYGLLLVVALRTGVYPWAGLVCGAFLMTGLVVARQVLALRENHRLLVTDHLTGLTTRAELKAEIARALAVAERTGRPVAVLVLDLDGFKLINDTRGHEVGDAALCAFAATLRAAVAQPGAPPGATPARLGGDEFAIAVPQVAGEAQAALLALAVQDALMVPRVVGGEPTRLRVSTGVALSRPGDEVRDLLHRADVAMYEAKRAGLGWTCADGPAPDPAQATSQTTR